MWMKIKKVVGTFPKREMVQSQSNERKLIHKERGSMSLDMLLAQGIFLLLFVFLIYVNLRMVLLVSIGNNLLVITRVRLRTSVSKNSIG